MKKNYSDGLEFLIKKHVCVLTEMALQQPMEGHYQAIHEKFAKLVRKSEELGISYYYEEPGYFFCLCLLPLYYRTK